MADLLIRHRIKVMVGVLLITYSVGLVGILSPYQDSFLNLTFYHLSLTFFLLAFSFYKLNRATLLAFFVAFGTGIAVEWIGVHTSLLFGEYAYGSNLGPKLWGVPLIIGVNWALLSSISCEMSRVLVKNFYVRVFLSATLMVGIDILIEPIAHLMDFWHWEDNEIPVFNFICWFVIALGVNTIYLKLTKDNLNYFSFWVFFALVTFFVTLNLAL
ncbi:hypothetical protein GCM10009118_05680 [Wandonia haliotis]|uniref:Carotenoid biosynthesis protein n=1 Tax=Wandonia haliotis TaxID=574963 RepID=A0ABN1MLN5_9FLAO